MKKAVKWLLIALIFQGGSSLNAQEKTGKKDLLEKFSITPQIGLLHSWSDFKDDGLDGFFDNNELGVNLLVNYKWNKFISISAGGLYGQLSGSSDKINTAGASNPPSRDLGFGVFYETDIFELTLPRVDVNLTKLIFQDKSNLFNKFSVGLIGSYGLIYSDSEIYAKRDENLNLNYINEAARSDKRGSSGDMVEGVISYGMSLSYIINDRFDVGIESTIRNVRNDRLDAWETSGSANDKYSYTAVGVTYHLRKREAATNFVNYAPNTLANKEEKEEVIEEVEVEEMIEEKQPAVVEESKEEVWEELLEVLETDKDKVVSEVTEKKESVSNKLEVRDFKEDIIKFELNSNKESAALNNQVRSIAEKLKNSPTTKITLGGYTDRSGSTSFNKTLSIQRAKWVKDQLVRKYGISNDRIIVIGHGEAGTTKEYDPNNRKVEVIEVK